LKIRRAEKIFLDRAKKFTRTSSAEDEIELSRENLRSLTMASRADMLARAIRAEFRARRVRSLASEISFTIRALLDKFFSTLVLIAK